MGFPTSFKRDERTGEQYKQIGNSVAISVIEAIAKQIIKQGLLDEEPQTEIAGNLQALLYN